MTDIHFIADIDISSKLEYEVCGTIYPGDVYIRAYESAGRDPELRNEIAAVEEKYIKKWCDYYTSGGNYEL